MPSHSDKNRPDLDSRVTEVVSSAAAPPDVRFKLKERYLIERELGRGGIGVVYLARDERLHSMPVVIKFLLDISEQNAWLATKFLQEAEALTRINHPGVVKVIDRDTADDGRPFFVMEFVAGRPLRTALKPGGMDLVEAAAIIRQIGHALNAAHQQGIIHRDLKPENILLQHLSAGEEHVKVIDFGIAKVSDSQSGAATEVSVIAGSLQYIAPEQLNSQPVSTATDVYTLSIVAYEMVTGRRPFETNVGGYLAAVQQLAELQRTERFTPPREFRPELSARAEALIRAGLSFDTSKRPNDARVFADDLAKALTEARSATQSATPDSTEVISYPGLTPSSQPAAVVNERSRNRTWLWLLLGGAALVISIVAILATALPGFRGTQQSPPQPGASGAVTAESTLIYSVTVQKDPRRYPDSKPFQLPGEVIFSPGDRIRLSIESPQNGFLYIINEGPASTGGAPSYNTLFPSTISRNGAAAIAAGEKIRLPDRGDGFVFDNQEGVEKLWLIFGVSPIPELEKVKRWANPHDGGTIGDAGEVESVRRFLSEQSATAATVEKDETNRHTTVRAKSPIVARLIKLEHH